MKYRPNAIYHVFNRGINRQNIFFEDRNYDYFLGKMRKHLLPNAHILAYCLMPNHFHWLLTPTIEGSSVGNGKIPVFDRQGNSDLLGVQELSKSIGIILSSFTQGINRAQGRTGSLFQQSTPMVSCFEFNGDLWNVTEGPADKSHPVNCFHYVHDNPVNAGLCQVAEEWEHSSALDYAGWRDKGICSYRVTESMLGISRVPNRF